MLRVVFLRESTTINQNNDCLFVINVNDCSFKGRKLSINQNI